MGGHGNHAFSLETSQNSTSIPFHTITSPFGYTFSLNDRMGWQFIFSDAAGQHIVSQLAEIMGLSPSLTSSGNPKFLFTSSEPDSAIFSLLASDNGAVLETGWNVLTFPFLQLWQHDQTPDTICQVSDQRDYLLDVMTMMMAMYPIVVSTLNVGGLLFHAGLVEKKNRGVLLAGPGGTGKSTCCSRVPSPWRALCDDESIIMPAYDSCQAHPFPTWSEFTYQPSLSPKMWHVNHKTDLAAICFLEQAESDKLIPVGPGEAAAKINESALQMLARYLVSLGEQAKVIRSKVFENAVTLAKTIPAYRLQVRKNGQFWHTLEEII